MPWSVKYDAELGIVCIVNSGRITIDEFKEGAFEIIAQARKHRTNLVLIDDSKLEITVSTNDIFKMPQFYEDAKAYRGSRWALIQPPEGPALKELKFYETVCRNRGWLVKLFSDRQAAVDWLLNEPEAGKPDASEG